jgi:drug/metabolite transporter (DMT)-like permease
MLAARMDVHAGIFTTNGRAAVGFALLSFLFAGLNDVVFKRYVVGDRSRGMLVLGVGVVWTFLQLVVLTVRGVAPTFDAATVRFGLGAGTLLVLSNVLLLESLSQVDLSVGSTIYRLNTLGVVVLSFVFLDEHIGRLQALGIAAGVAAVLLLAHRPARHARSPRDALFLAAVVAAALLRAAYGVTTRKAMLAHVAPAPLLLLISSSWIVGGGTYAAVRERRLRLTREKAIYAAVSGSLVFLIASSLMLAVERGEASVVIPIANMSFVVALGLSLVSGMEKLTARKLVAVGAAVASIVLLAQA